MSDTINTIVDKKAYQQVRDLAEELKKSRLELVQLLDIAKGGGVSFKSIQIPSDLDKQIKKNRTETEHLSEALKEQDRLEKSLIKQLQKKEIATEATNKALIKARAETQQINKEQKRQAIISSDLTGEYKKQSTILNTLRDRYKDMVLSQKGGTKEARRMKQEIDELDSKLKAVDASVGQHQRNVGNYQSALGNLAPGLDRVNMGLEGMGTSLDDLSNSKNPFKDLTTAVTNFGRATMAFLLSPIGLAISAIGALFLLINRNKDTVIQFDSQLTNVGKTTGLAGKELKGLGNDIIGLSRRLQVVGTPALMDYAIAAGQLGVKGRQNIVNFAEALAKLETASDISGEEGARSIARLLTLTDGGTKNVKAFGDEIVNLGNNVAATEKEILSNSEAIAQNIGQYDFGRQYVLAYGAATKAVGIEAEITGSTIGRTLGNFEKAIRTGANLDTIIRVTGKSAEELKSQFASDASGVFTEFIEGLNRIDKAGGSVNKQLEEIGITAVRDQRVLGSLSTRGFGELQKSIQLTADAAGALDEEFKTAAGKLEKQLERVGTAWDNLVLSLENGQGVFGKFFAWLSGEAASYLEKITIAVNVFGAAWSGVSAMVGEFKDQMVEFLKTLSMFGDIEIDLMNPGKMADSAKEVLSKLKDQLGGKGAKEVGQAFVDGFRGTLNKIKAENILRKAMEEAEKNTPEDEDEDDGIKYKKGSIAAIQASITALQAQRDNFATTTEEVRNYNEWIAQLQEKLDKLNGKVVKTEVEITQKGIGASETPGITATTDVGELERYQFQKNEEAKTKILEEESEKRRQLIADSFSQFAEYYGIDFSAFENLITKKEELTKEDYVQAAASAAKAIVSLTSKQYDQELQLAVQQRDAILNNEKASDEQKLLAKKEYEEKVNKIKRDQAEAEKRAMLFEIAINTAAAVVQALPNIPLSILAGVLGAAQFAFVAAQPVPKFKDGHLLGTHQGMAMVNDAPGNNYKEVVESPDGSIALPQRRNTLIDMKRGTKVYKNYDDFLKRKNYNSILNASMLTSLANQNEQISSKDLEDHFNMQLRNDLQQGIKEGFRNIQMNTTVNNSNDALLRELKNQRRRDV